MFAINASSGVVTLTSRFDYETSHQYFFTVVATTGGNLSTVANVFVAVTDVFDAENTPVPTKTVYHSTISEYCPIGTYVTQVAAIDPDAHISTDLIYIIASANPINAFTINSTTGVITTANEIDYEVVDSYSLLVRIENKFASSIFTNVLVTVSVLDVNNVPPQFVAASSNNAIFTDNPPHYVVQKTVDPAACAHPFELCTVGLVIVAPYAVDDSGSAANFTYMLLDNDNPYFEVDESTGVITLAQPLDREVTGSHITLSLWVTDQGEWPLTSIATIDLTIGDLNDNTPKFDRQSYANIVVPEDLALGTVLTQFYASDIDEGLNGLVSFTVSGGNGDFTINATSGALSLISPLDYETATSLILLIQASDHGVPSRFSIVTLVVNVTDVNDNIPSFVSAPTNYIQISEVTPIGSYLFFVEGTDLDGTALNSDIETLIVEQPAGFYFEVDPVYGAVTPRGTPRLVSLGSQIAYDAATSNEYAVTVRLNNTRAVVPHHQDSTFVIQVLPFITEVQGSVSSITFNWASPDPCALYPDTSYCQVASGSRRRSAYSQTFDYELVERRDFNCVPTKCQNITFTAQPGVCDCIVIGPQSPAYNQSATEFTLSSFTGGSDYQYYLRFFQNGVALYETTPVAYTSQDFAPSNVAITKLAGNTVNVTWDAPTQPDGVINGYRVCYCPSYATPTADDCSCSWWNHTIAPQNGYTFNTFLQVPDQGSVSGSKSLAPNVYYYFVVQVETIIPGQASYVFHESPVASLDIPFITAGIVTTGASTNSVGGATLASILVPLLFAIFTVALLVLVLVRRHRTNMRDLQAKHADQLQEKDAIISELHAQSPKSDIGYKQEPVAPPPTKLTKAELIDKIFGDSESVHRNPYETGYWDYHAQDRANLFLGTSTTDVPDEPEDEYMEVRPVAPSPVKKSPTKSLQKIPRVKSLTLDTAGESSTESTLPSLGLKVKILERLRQGAVTDEFVQIKKDPAYPQSAFTEANKPVNYRKNRYGNVLPLDKTRVKLSNTGVNGSDFINANYVDGWKAPKAFIATQAPVPTTVQDFWRMIWESNSGIIAMVTKEVELGKTKCHKYWPDERGTLQCGTLEISWVSQTELSPDFSVRRFVLYNPRLDESREITQFYYHAWPDQGVPEKPLSVLQYITAINKQRDRNVLQNKCIGPVTVHCSAGIGRAGALIALDICIKRLGDLGNIDILQTVQFIRTQRAGAVQTADQYEFIYEAMSIYPENRAALDKAETGEAVPVAVSLTVKDIGLSEREKKALAALTKGSGAETPLKDDNSLIAALNKI